MSNVPSREEALFADALAQPPAARGAFLGQACGTDAALLARIAGLLVGGQSDARPKDSVAELLRLPEENRIA